MWRRVPAALGGVLAAVLAAWAASQLALDSHVPAMAMLAAVPGAWAGWRLSRVAPGRIAWDGGQWSCRGAAGSEPEPGQPELALDWGDWLLLRWQAAGIASRRGRCIPLARRDLPSHWHLLRVALRQPPASQAQGRLLGAGQRGDAP